MFLVQKWKRVERKKEAAPLPHQPPALNLLQ
jgi:hypothetical protein